MHFVQVAFQRCSRHTCALAACSLDAVVQLATIDEFLTLKAARSYNGAMEWMQLAEQCGLDRTWAAGVRCACWQIADGVYSRQPEAFGRPCFSAPSLWAHRMHATACKHQRFPLHQSAFLLLVQGPCVGLIALPEGIATTHRSAKGLSSLGRDTITAVLAAVAASLRGFGSQTIAQAASAIPDAAILLAGRNEAAFGSASLLWEVPQLSGARASRQSPAFGPANWRGSSANAPMFHLEVHGPQEVPLNDAGNGPLLLGNGLSVTLVATFKDDCPPGVALAAVLTVGLHGGVSQVPAP